MLFVEFSVSKTGENHKEKSLVKKPDEKTADSDNGVWNFGGMQYLSADLKAGWRESTVDAFWVWRSQCAVR